MARASAHKWVFRSRFRRGAFGWRSQPAITRVKEAVREIVKTAKMDPVLAAEGAVIFLEKVSPAIEHVDSSSGAIGTAVNAAIDTLVPIIADAPTTTEKQRQGWLERLYRAHGEEQIPYIESLADHWGVLCATPELASRWADDLIDLTRHVLAQETPGAFFHGTTACLSALFAAGRHDELLDLVEGKTSWYLRVWAVKALAASGRKQKAIELAEASRGPWTPGLAVDQLCEEILLSSGLVDEAYRRYGLRASRARTYLAWFRAACKRYPHVPREQVLEDLIGETRGDEGKWFAAAKSEGLYDRAIALARKSPTAPQTLIRAARDFAERRPDFAVEAGLAALSWIARGQGYEITLRDILEAHDHTMAAAAQAGTTIETRRRIGVLLAQDAPMHREMNQALASRLGDKP